jgi:protein-disulfide isomerase
MLAARAPSEQFRGHVVLTDAAIRAGELVISGRTSGRRAAVALDGKFTTTSDRRGRFAFHVSYFPASCLVALKSGDVERKVVVANCAVAPEGSSGQRVAQGEAGPRGPQGPAGPPGEPGIAAPQASQQSDATSPPKDAIEKIVRDYLLSRPEVLQEAMAELEKRQNAEEVEKHLASIKDNAPAIFSSAHQVNMGNPQGDVTMVEFFDYNCAFCKRAMSDMLDLMKSDPKLKVVLKEFPVLGEGSVQAAQVAVAARMQDKTGKKYIDFHTKLLGGRGPADKARALAVAKEVGFDMARLDKDMQSDEVKQTLEESRKLAEGLGLNGTPSYVFPAEVVVGAVGLPALQGKINTARCGKETC